MGILKEIKKRIFPTMVALSALSVSVSAAFYSVSGLICVQIAQKSICISGKTFAVKDIRRMNGDLTFYNLFGSGVSCLRIKRLRDLEIEFLICEILSTLSE